MNKTLISLLLLGMVVVAMAGDAAQEKMRLKKAKLMARKQRMDLSKKKIPSAGDFSKRGKDVFREKYEELEQQRSAMGEEQFKEQVRRLKDEVKRARAGAISERKEVAQKERSKRSAAKETYRKGGMKANSINKGRKQ